MDSRLCEQYHTIRSAIKKVWKKISYKILLFVTVSTHSKNKVEIRCGCLNEYLITKIITEL